MEKCTMYFFAGNFADGTICPKIIVGGQDAVQVEFGKIMRKMKRKKNHTLIASAYSSNKYSYDDALEKFREQMDSTRELHVREERTVYIFVGIPAIHSTYSRMVTGFDYQIKAEIENMIDTLEGSRIHKAIWTVTEVGTCTYSEACRNFGVDMENYIKMQEGEGEQI